MLTKRNVQQMNCVMAFLEVLGVARHQRLAVRSAAN
jgi:hypothetical protein